MKLAITIFVLLNDLCFSDTSVVWQERELSLIPVWREVARLFNIGNRSLLLSVHVRLLNIAILALVDTGSDCYGVREVELHYPGPGIIVSLSARLGKDP